MLLHPRTLKYAAMAGALVCSAAAHAASDPAGLWLDHDGRGAVEIGPCPDGNGLCGYVVHIKDPANSGRCGLQILGNVTPGGGGWIYSPERKRKYPVALTRLSGDNLRVVGNAGSMFSRTFTWNRAPDDVPRCGETVAASPAEPAETHPATSTSQPASGPAATPERAAARPPVLIGASSGAVALMASPRPRVSEPEPVAAPVHAPVEEPTTEPAPVTKNASPDAGVDAGVERMCKFRIPYVGRVIDVPCRD